MLAAVWNPNDIDSVTDEKIYRHIPIQRVSKFFLSFPHTNTEKIKGRIIKKYGYFPPTHSPGSSALWAR